VESQKSKGKGKKNWSTGGFLIFDFLLFSWNDYFGIT